MPDIDNVKNNVDSINKNFESEMDLKRIREQVIKRYDEYRNTLKYLAADAPVEVLCMPKQIENILLSNGFLRVYDLFDMDFTEIKGLGVARSRDLAARLDEFFSML